MNSIYPGIMDSEFSQMLSAALAERVRISLPPWGRHDFGLNGPVYEAAVDCSPEAPYYISYREEEAGGRSIRKCCQPHRCDATCARICPHDPGRCDWNGVIAEA
jgi:hypothetical protein